MFNYLKSLVKKAKVVNSVPTVFSWREQSAFYSADAREYISNPIVYRCVKLIATSASHVPLIVMTKNGGKRIRNDNHICARVLRRPNPQQGGAEFFAAAVTNELLFGESYILLAKPEVANSYLELYLLNNKNVELSISQEGQLNAYLYSNAKDKLCYSIDPLTKQSKVLHLKNYNPLNQTRGISCLSPASLAISLHKMAMDWNCALLKNGARPSGAIIVKDSNRYLREEQFERLKIEIQEKYANSVNAGRPMLLEGGLDWKEMSMSPKDMDFSESKDAAAREIALACGVPPQILGIKGDNTYSNMQEARVALWEETIIPLLDKLSDALSNWLSYWMGEDILIDFDRDKISALSKRREHLWNRIVGVDFMTINEKRNFVGLPPISGGDVLQNGK